MSHDPRLTILYSFIGSAIDEGVSVIVFDGGEGGLYVTYDGAPLALPEPIPAGLFGGLRYWVLQRCGLQDAPAAQHGEFVVHDTSKEICVGVPFGCPHDVHVGATVDATRIELRVQKIQP